MGEQISLRADDGHELGAYEAKAAPCKGRVVVIMEILGVNRHIRNVCDRFAAAGYTALAPAMFDRIERGVDLDLEQDGAFEKGVALMNALHPERLEEELLDIKAASDHLGRPREVGVVGYSYGGTLSWWAACRLDLGCASSYYGRIDATLGAEVPRCPTICHFGAKDKSIPKAMAEALRVQRPDIGVHVYDADHAFNNDDAPEYYDEAAAALAQAWTLELFAKHLK
jgi:carboxymethylenebutenolidase